MFLAGPAPLPGEYRFLPLERAAAESCPPTRPSGRCSPSTARTRAGSAPTRRCCTRRRSRSTSTTTTTTRASATSTSSTPTASSTGEVLRDVFRELGIELTPELAEPLYVALVTDTGRFQYANTTPKALRLAAELVEAGADVHKVFQGVYESVQFAKLKLLARALERAQVYEGGGLVVSYLLRDDFAEVGAVEPYSEGIIDFLRAVEGADMAALIREPPRGGSPARRISLRASHDELDVSAIARESGGGGHRQAAGFSSDDSIDEITALPRAASSSPLRAGRAADAAARASSRAGSSSSTSRPGRPRSRSSRASASRTGTKMGHAGTLDPFATGLLLLLSGRVDKIGGIVRRTRQALSHGRRPDGPYVHGRSGGRGRRSGTSAPTPDGARAAARGPPRRDRAADPGRVGGQDRR